MIKIRTRKYLSWLLVLLLLIITYTGSTISEQPTNDPKEYTHTVMVEVGTATWCPSCPAANAFWHTTYATGNYDFEYTEMVIDKNTVANNYMQNHYNLYWVPTNYFDGGAELASGSSGLAALLDDAGEREVYDIDGAFTTCLWSGQSQIAVEVAITNNEPTTYDGTLRVYVIEKVSSLWNDYSGTDYYHAFLDFIINTNISIPAGNTLNIANTWDGTALYPNLVMSNCQVILAVNNDEWHQGNSQDDPGTPDNAYFSAYYIDETTAADPISNLAPVAGFSYTPEYPEALETVTFTDTSSDPDGSVVGWNWDFGDSGTSTMQHPTHSYASKGYYTVSLTIEDDAGASNTYSETIIVTAVGETLFADQTLFNRGFPVRHAADGDWGSAQSFTVTSGTITNADIYMRKMGAPAFDLTVQLRETNPEGTLLDELVFTPSQVGTTWSWFNLDFDDTIVTPGTTYLIVIQPAPPGQPNSNGYEWGYALGNQYDGGAFWFTRDGGGLWRDLPTMYEFVFCVYGL